MKAWNLRRAAASRYQRRNQNRSQRAREHLDRVRRRERQRLHQREPGTPRAATTVRTGAIRLVLMGAFFIPLALGILLARPLEALLLSWTGPESNRLEKIAIQGNHQLSFQEVALATGIERGQPMAEIQLEQVEARLAEQAWIKAAHVLRLPPSTLVVSVEEFEPRALLLDPAEPERAVRTRLVDANGIVFAVASGHEDLPRLLGGEGIETGSDHELLTHGLQLLQRLSGADIDPVVYGGSPLTLQLPDESSSDGWVLRGRVEVVLGRRQLEERINRLTELLRNDEVRELLSKNELRIDLRFAKQAVLALTDPDVQT